MTLDEIEKRKEELFKLLDSIEDEIDELKDKIIQNNNEANLIRANLKQQDEEADEKEINGRESRENLTNIFVADPFQLHEQSREYQLKIDELIDKQRRTLDEIEALDKEIPDESRKSDEGR